MKKYVIMLAGGNGSRMNAGINKVFIPLCGKTVLCRSMESFVGFADEMIIVCRREDWDKVICETNRCNFPFSVRFTLGGNTRQASVLNGLRGLSPDSDDIVLIHDAARCLVDKELIARVIRSVLDYGTGIPGIPVTSTYKFCDNDYNIQSTPDRSTLYEIQTPQGFHAKTIIQASVRASEEGFETTDDAGILEHYHIPVRLVRGSSSNIKLTNRQDLAIANLILKEGAFSMRVGMGYDVHRLVPDRKLYLCGVEIPFEYGLLGHSDADVALHALMDAMLGACALGDIGKHFPDSDNQFKDISSLLLLKRVVGILLENEYRVNNADITIVAQKPKVLPYIPHMIKTVSEVLDIPESSVNIKATTTENLGFEGRMEGISAYAVCTVEKL